MGAVNFFESVEYLEPRCPKCDQVLEYGVNTKYDQKRKNHVCLGCGAVLQ
jgi:phage FluMu protein Com